MVTRFDMDSSDAGNKLLMDKPQYSGSSLPSCPGDLDMSLEEDEVMLSQLRKTSGTTTIKIILENELSKDVEPKHAPPNLVARLMGLDTLPKRRITTLSNGKEDCGRIVIGLEEPLSSRTYVPVFSGKAMPCEVEQDTKEFISDPYYPQEMGNGEQDMAFFNHKYFNTRHFSANENLDSSEESEGELKNFKANKDLFLKFLQQPNSLFAQYLHEMSAHPPSCMKRITVLKPSMTTDNSKFPSKITDKWVSKQAHANQQTNALNKTNIGGFPRSSKWKNDDVHQPTRIVVLKPCSEKAIHTRDEFTSPYYSPRTLPDKNYFRSRVQHDAQQSRDIAKEVTTIIRESLGSLQMDDAFLSSVVSSGYNGDESSPDKSENEYAAESDGEPVSHTSRYPWDYIDQFGSCSSSISRVPRSRESSVCKEAKKRLSRRWNAIRLNENSQGYRHARSHSSNTLGEMLALSEIKKSIRSPDTDGELMGSAASLNQNSKEAQTAVYSPGNLVRSSSVPLCTAGNYEWMNGEMSHPEVVNLPDEKELQKINGLKQLVANLFFTRNKKTDKESSMEVNIARGTAPLEMGLSVAKPATAGNIMESQDQPSPVSVLEPLFGDDGSRSADSSCILTSEHPVMKTSVYKSNSPIVGKSPPIESITRTLCWNNSYVDTPTACPFDLSIVCSEPEEEQDWNNLVHALLSTVGISNYQPSDACVDWRDVPQSSLDPLLRDMYANAVNRFMHGTKLRRWRSNRKLIFDSVNQALKDMSQIELETSIKNGTGHPETILPILVDQVWATMSKYISSNVRCVPTDDEDEINWNLVVHRVVREEVAGKRWLDSRLMNTTTVGIDIQQKLLDELLEETVLQVAIR